MMEIFQKMNFSLLLYDANSSKNPDFLYKITNILTWKNSTKLKWVFGRVSFSKKGHTYSRSDLIHRFGRPVPEIWMITNHVIETVYSLHHHRYRIEPHLNEPAFASDICWCYTKERKCFAELLWFHRWYSKTHLQTRRKPKNRIQRTQKSSRFEISIRFVALWYDSQHVWTSR